LQVAVIETSRCVNDRTHLARERVDCSGAEIALEALLGVERRFRRPAQTEVECQSLRDFPVVLKIQTINVVAWQPGVDVTREVYLAHGAEFESSEGVAGIGYRLAVRLKAGSHVIELENAARLPHL